MKYEYKFITDSSIGPVDYRLGDEAVDNLRIGLYVYIPLKDIDSIQHWRVANCYLLVFYKINNVYVCNNSELPVNIKNWLVKHKIIKTGKHSIIKLTSKSLLEIL